MGTDGTKNGPVHSPPPDTFGSRALDQLLHNGISPAADNSLNIARDWARSANGQVGSPSRSSPRDKSPPNLHQSFVRDHGDQRSSGKAPRRSEWFSSPDRQYRYERDDRWAQHPRRSSPTRRTSPPRRPSPPRQSSYGYSERLRSPVVHPPGTHGRHARRASETLDFANLSWRVPDHVKPQISDCDFSGSEDHKANRGSAPSSHSLNGTSRDPSTGRVSYNGLKDVPTGPKKGFSALTPVSAMTKERPHIFVSPEDLPPKRSTVEHLYGALKLSQPDIHFDGSGWYLCFEDTPTGREKLQDCYQRRNKMRLFGTYTIHMELFPFGALSHPVSHSGPAILSPRSSRVAESNAPNGNAVEMSATNGGAFETSVPRNATARAESSPETVAADALYLNRALLDSSGMNGSHVAEVESVLSKVVPDVDSSALSGVRPSLGWQSSPLRVPSRFDWEDSSSCISVLTGSDSSRSKRLKCHVCKTGDLSDSDTLITCSSCPRRYHRRCHVHPAIPAELDRDHNWQCRRCIKKQGKPRSNLRSSSPAAELTTSRLDLPADEPPRKRPRLDSVEPHGVSVPPALETTAADDDDDYVPSEVLDQSPCFTIATEQNIVDASTIKMNGAPPQSDETHFHEADDLVAKSFAATAVINMSPTNTTPGKKPALVRRKVARREKSHHQYTAVEPQTILPLPKEQPLSAHEESMSRAMDDSDDINDETPDRKRKVPRLNGALVDEPATQKTNAPLSGHRDSASTHFQTNVAHALTTSHELAAPIEIPESPEEIRKPTHMIITTNGTMKLTERSAIHAELLNSEAVLSKLLEGETGAKGQRTKLQRMKPGPQTTDRCTNCSKKIAYNPSGANKFCMKCKAAMSATPSIDNTTPLDAGGTKTTSETSASANLAKEPSEAVAREDSGFDSRQALDTGLSSLSTSAGATAEPELHESTLHKSCDGCKMLHDRCTHIESALSHEGEDDPQGKSRGAETKPQDVLDFWTPAVTTSDKENASDIGVGPPVPGIVSRTQSRGESEMLSDPAEDPDEAPRAAVPKRKSQTRPALSQHDLGDSIERPKGAYEKLIGMALCSAPGYRMRGTDVTDWVAKNISGYKKGEGKWESSLRATLTLKKQGYGGRDGLWEKIESAGAKKNETCWWQLLPGQADKMLHWDPVLGQPVSPLKSSQKEHSMTLQHEAADASEEDLSIAPARKLKLLQARRKKQERRRRLRQGQSESVEAALPSTIDRESLQSTKERIADINSSSDEEPLLKRKKPTPKTSLPANDAAMIDSAETLDYPHASAQDADPVQGPSPFLKLASPNDAAQKQNTLRAQYPSKPVSIADMIALEAEDTKYSAKSLFAEWPEYDTKHNLDRESKIAQIKNRPTRKQKFAQRFDQGSADQQKLIAEMGSPHPAIEYIAMNESPSKTGRSVLYPWETTEDNLLHCTSLEELFNLPKNPVAIIHDGQLAYRDGTRNEDGTLPRAKVIYKTGYGKGDTGR